MAKGQSNYQANSGQRAGTGAIYPQPAAPSSGGFQLPMGNTSTGGTFNPGNYTTSPLGNVSGSPYNTLNARPPITSPMGQTPGQPTPPVNPTWQMSGGPQQMPIITPMVQPTAPTSIFKMQPPITTPMMQTAPAFQPQGPIGKRAMLPLQTGNNKNDLM